MDILKEDIIFEAERLRGLGFEPDLALAYAQTICRFGYAEERRLARLRVVEDERYELGPAPGALIDRIAKAGVWRVLGEYRAQPGLPWALGSQSDGCVGEDWRDAEEVDVMGAVLVALDAACERRAA